MPRLPRLIVALAASSAGMLLAGTGHAATQALALLETKGATALHCDGEICRAEFSTFCLQEERELPRSGDPYRLAAGSQLTLVLTGQDGKTQRIPAADHIRITAARSGHTAVTISVVQSRLAALGARKAAIAAGEQITLFPHPVAGDDNPQTEQDKRIAAGLLRQLGAKIVHRGQHDVERVQALNGLINALPDQIDRRPDARQSLWRSAADTVLRDAPDDRIKRAKQEYAACWRDRVVQLGGYSVRHCLQSRHDRLMWQHVKRYWGAVGAGS